MKNWQSIFNRVERLKRDTEMKLQLFKLYYEKQMTLQQIGDEFRVTRERIRQIMDRLAMPRYKSYSGSEHRKRGFKTIDEYFKHVKNGGKESRQILLKFIAPLKKRCEECGSTRKLAIHHLKYPATSLDDIRILCYLCHCAKHGRRGLIFQRKICNEYLNGQEAIELAREYGVSYTPVYRILHQHNIEMRGYANASP